MAKQYDYDEIEKSFAPDAHIFGEDLQKNLVDFHVDENYRFKTTNPIAWFFSHVLYLTVLTITPILLFVMHGVKVKGRRNLKGLKTGAITISNHVLTLDNMCVAQAMFPKKIRFQSEEVNFRMPGIRHMIKALGAYPIPYSMRAKQAYIKYTDELLQNKKFVHIYPEASLWPYYEKIRPFKPGAFHFAVRNNVPVVPICIHFREQTPLVKKLGVKAKFVTVHIGKPIYPDATLSQKDSIQKLKNQSELTVRRMNRFFKLVDKGYFQRTATKGKEII